LLERKSPRATGRISHFHTISKLAEKVLGLIGKIGSILFRENKVIQCWGRGC
jgi:hypothetical protein